MDIHLSNFKKMMGLLGFLSLASIKFAFKKIGVLRGFGPEKCPIWILPQIFFQKIGVLRGCRPKKKAKAGYGNQLKWANIGVYLGSA